MSQATAPICLEHEMPENECLSFAHIGGRSLQVFQLNDCDWWVGRDEAEVKADYLEITGLTAEEAFDDFHAISRADMERLVVVEESGKTMTFLAKLQEMIAAGESFPCLFASTEY